jgi:hypothetical protein
MAAPDFSIIFLRPVCFPTQEVTTSEVGDRGGEL